MSAPIVVNIRSGKPFDVYLGRACPSARNWRLRATSPFANPFHVGPLWRQTRRGPVRDGLACETADAMYARLERDFRAAAAEVEDFRIKLRLLNGKRIGCWDERHGAAIVRVVEWINAGMPAEGARVEA